MSSPLELFGFQVSVRFLPGLPEQTQGTISVDKLQGRSTTSQKKARSALTKVEPFVSDLDGPRNEDSKEVSKKVGGIE